MIGERRDPGVRGSVRTRAFREQFDGLPQNVQQRGQLLHRQIAADLASCGDLREITRTCLRWHKITHETNRDVYSANVTFNYRAYCIIDDEDRFVWFKIDSHLTNAEIARMAIPSEERPARVK